MSLRTSDLVNLLFQHQGAPLGHFRKSVVETVSSMNIEVDFCMFNTFQKIHDTFFCIQTQNRCLDYFPPIFNFGTNDHLMVSSFNVQLVYLDK